MPRPTELPAHALRAEDFEHTPVWRYLVPDESTDPDADESFVRPHTPDLDLGDCASYLVRATFTLKSGVHLPGFMELTVLDRKVEWTPGVVFAGGKAVEALGKDTAVRLERILKIANAQPVSWQLDVRFAGEDDHRHGRIAAPGFAQALGLLVQLGRLRRMRRS